MTAFLGRSSARSIGIILIGLRAVFSGADLFAVHGEIIARGPALAVVEFGHGRPVGQ